MLKIFCTSCDGNEPEGMRCTHMIDLTCSKCGKTIPKGGEAVIRQFCDRCGKEIPKGAIVGDMAFFVKNNRYDDEEGQPFLLNIDLCRNCMEEIAEAFVEEK